MSVLRKDPVIDRWIIVAEKRGMRPTDFLQAGQNVSMICPFCYGNERMTPSEIYALRKENTKENEEGWIIRVINNKFPALENAKDIECSDAGLFESLSGFGRHEVIIETPIHDACLSELKLSHIIKVIEIYKDRYIELKKDPRLIFIMLFKNHGHKSGASLKHPHSQLIATPIIPKRIKEELRGARKFFEKENKCIFCEVIEEEIKLQTRIITENEYFVALCPFAARFPFETRILPKLHKTNFEDISREELEAFASIYKDVLSALRITMKNFEYNTIFHSGLNVSSIKDKEFENLNKYYHWYLEIIPKTISTAGFEWGTGFYINTVCPDDAADFLRNAIK